MIHFEVWLSFFCLVGFSSLISNIGRQSFALSFLYSQIGILLILYFAGLSLSLQPTAQIIRIFGLTLFVTLSIPKLVRNWNEPKNHATIFLATGCFGFYLLTLTPNYFTFAQIDDFSHWGRMSRLIFLNNRFIEANDPIGVKDYPPGLALIHYFYSNFSGFKERIVLFAQGIFVISCLAVVIQPLDFNRIKFNLAALCIASAACLSLIWIFYYGLHSIWADLPLGLLFGLALWIFLSGHHAKSIRIAQVAPLLLCMPLIKQMGLVFVFISGFVLLTCIIFERSKDRHTNILLVIIFSIAAIFIDHSWKTYLIAQGMQRTFNFNQGFYDVIKAFVPHYSSEREKITVDAFINHFFLKVNFTTYWILLCMATSISVYKSTCAVKRPQVLVQIGSVFLGFLLYLLLLLVLYMFSFSEFEGTRLASVDRYTKTYLLGFLLAFGGVFFGNVYSDFEWRKKKQWAFIMAFFFIVPNLGRIGTDLARSLAGSEAPYWAVKIHRQAEKVTQLTSPNARIYFLWAQGSNDESVIFNYGIYPRTSNQSCSSMRPLGVTVDGSDPWVCITSREEFEGKLRNYDYVFVGKVSDELQTAFFSPYGMENVRAGDLYLMDRVSGILRFVKI